MEENRALTEEEKIEKIIERGREFLKCPEEDANPSDLVDYKTDQELRKPQPPLYKKPCGGPVIELPKDFTKMAFLDALSMFAARKSSRFYSEQPLTLMELSFLCWVQQGVKSIRGNHYATIRTVPCGGARHEFELYIAVRHVEGLVPGAYHYMPDRHAVELIQEENSDPAFRETITETMMGQKWAGAAPVSFYYSVIPYRAEWRYGIFSHRIILVDAGHITENLYLGCTALGMGTCAVGAVSTKRSNALFHLDGKEEYIFYASPVGHISDADREKEKAVYAFVKEEKGAVEV